MLLIRLLRAVKVMRPSLDPRHSASADNLSSDTPPVTLPIDDQLEIQQLYARYNHFLDYNHPTEWAALFVADGSFTAPGAIEEVRGTAGLIAFARDVIPQFKARHFISNLVIDGEGGAATGSCYMFSWHVPGDGEPKTLLNVGVYVDELARANGRWLFKSRVLNLEP